MTGSEEEIWFPVVSRIYFSDFKCQNILLTETHKYAFQVVLPDGMYLLSCADRCHESCCMRCAVTYWCQTDSDIKSPDCRVMNTVRVLCMYAPVALLPRTMSVHKVQSADKVDRAFEERVESRALEHAVLKQRKVYELMHYSVVLCVVGNNLLLLVALLGNRLLRVLDIVFLLLGYFLRLLPFCV